MSTRAALWISGVPAFAVGTLLLALDGPLWDAGGPGIVGFELAGSERAAARILAEWGEEGRSAARISLFVDLVYLVTYGAFLALAAAAVRRTSPSAWLRRLGRFAPAAAVVAAACDLAEDVALLLVLDGAGGAIAPAAAAAFATLKFLLVACALGLVLAGLAVRRPRVVLALAGIAVVLVAVSVVVAERDTAPARAAGGQVVELPQGAVHVTLDGRADAPLLLLVHGFAADGRWWDRVVPRLARRFRVVRIDLLGHGRSEKPRDGYAMAAQADLVAGVARRLGIRRAAVAGHSMGGAVAVALAERHRSLVRRLTVVGTAPAEPDDGLSAVSPSFWPVTGQLTRLSASDDLIRWAVEQGLRPRVDASDAQLAAFDAITWRAYSGSARELRRFWREAPLDVRLRRAGVPVTAIFGQTDPQVGEARRYARVPGSRLVVVPGAGHSPMLDQPERTATLLARAAERL